MQKDESRWQSTDCSKAFRNTSAFKWRSITSQYKRTFVAFFRKTVTFLKTIQTRGKTHSSRDNDHGWRNHFESGGTKNCGIFLWSESTTVTSQPLKMTSMNFVSMQFYAVFYKAFTTPICTTPTLHWLEHINVTSCS